MTSPTFSPKPRPRPWSDCQISGSSAKAGLVGVADPPRRLDGEGQGLRVAEVGQHRGGRRRDGLGVHRPRRLRCRCAPTNHIWYTVPGLGGATLFITSTPASFVAGEHHRRGAAGRNVARHGPHVRRGEDLLGGRRGVVPAASRIRRRGRRARWPAPRPLPRIVVRQRIAAVARSWRTGSSPTVASSAVAQRGRAARRRSPRTPRPSSRGRRAPLSANAAATSAGAAASCRSMSASSASVTACSAYGVASAIRSGVGRLGHASPRHLRSPRMASRIRDLMVARFAASRSETWT